MLCLIKVTCSSYQQLQGPFVLTYCAEPLWTSMQSIRLQWFSVYELLTCLFFCYDQSDLHVIHWIAAALYVVHHHITLIYQWHLYYPVFLPSASAVVVILCRHIAELSNYFCEHVGSGSVRRPLHLRSLRHHLALCRSHCRPALWPAVCFQRQRGESPLCVLLRVVCDKSGYLIHLFFFRKEKHFNVDILPVYCAFIIHTNTPMVTNQIRRKGELMHNVTGSLVNVLDQHFIQTDVHQRWRRANLMLVHILQVSLICISMLRILKDDSNCQLNYYTCMQNEYEDPFSNSNLE